MNPPETSPWLVLAVWVMETLLAIHTTLIFLRRLIMLTRLRARLHTRIRGWTSRTTSPRLKVNDSSLSPKPLAALATDLLPEIARAKTAEEMEISVNPKILVLLLHLGSVLQTLRDIERGIADVVAGKASKDDAKLILQDVAGLLSNGVISLPGVSAQEMLSAVSELQSALAEPAKTA